MPRLGLIVPTLEDWARGIAGAGVPQLPLTLLNSVIAVCALSADYFPGRGVAPRRMAASVGLMNLLCAAFGAMPMCHGAGGLAGQYRFGARTGGSVIMLGILKIGAGVAMGGLILETLHNYPTSILAVLIIFAGVGLASAAKDSRSGKAAIVLLGTAIPAVLWTTLIGFACGCLIAVLMARWRDETESAPSR